jgi:3-O-methylgallate 3,4-dioxygenase
VEIDPEIMQARYEKCQTALIRVRDLILDAKPDVILMIGDDQREQFLESNMPMFCMYRGKSLTVVKPKETSTMLFAGAPWQKFDQKGLSDTAQAYPSDSEFAEDLIRSMVEDGFDLSCSNDLREDVGLGHAFTVLYRKILPGCTIPMVPLMINTFFPPNQALPKRCYQLGQGLRKAIDSSPHVRRVAVLASGGMSHVVIDEELDRLLIDLIARKDVEGLCAVPWTRIYPKGSPGTSEVLNWIALAGAMEPLQMSLIDYQPGYRSPAGTGCGMAFAYWHAE